MRLLDKPYVKLTKEDCFNSVGQSQAVLWIEAPDFEIYDLGDGTFLLIDAVSRVVARFDKDLNAPYLDQHPDFFIADYETVKTLVLKGHREAQGTCWPNCYQPGERMIEVAQRKYLQKFWPHWYMKRQHLREGNQK